MSNVNNFTWAFLITFMAGFFTLFGFLAIYIKYENYHKLIAISLAFAAGVMISTSITDLIPESLHLLLNSINLYSAILLCFFGIFLGIVLSMIIDYYIPDTFDYCENKSLYRVGLISMFVIIMHNIPEGIATFIASSNNVKLGLSLAIAIAMHNIPEGITISVPIYYSTGSVKKAFIYTLVSSLSEPFGALITFLFLKDIISELILGIILSVISGIMLEISFRTLLPKAKKYDNKLIFIFFIFGFLFMLFKFII